MTDSIAILLQSAEKDILLADMQQQLAHLALENAAYKRQAAFEEIKRLRTLRANNQSAEADARGSVGFRDVVGHAAGQSAARID